MEITLKLCLNSMAVLMCKQMLIYSNTVLIIITTAFIFHTKTLKAFVMKEGKKFPISHVPFHLSYVDRKWKPSWYGRSCCGQHNKFTNYHSNSTVLSRHLSKSIESNRFRMVGVQDCAVYQDSVELQPGNTQQKCGLHELVFNFGNGVTATAFLHFCRCPQQTKTHAHTLPV